MNFCRLQARRMIQTLNILNRFSKPRHKATDSETFQIFLTSHLLLTQRCFKSIPIFVAVIPQGPAHRALHIWGTAGIKRGQWDEPCPHGSIPICAPLAPGSDTILYIINHYYTILIRTYTMLILCLYYACTEFTDSTYHYYLVRLWDMPQLLSMTCWQIPSDSKLGRFLAEAVHHVGLGTLASTLPWRGATLRQGAPRGHRAGWKRRHGTTSDPTSYATYAYLCILMHTYATCFNILLTKCDCKMLQDISSKILPAALLKYLARYLESTFSPSCTS